MLLQNLTLLSNDTVVQVTNIAPAMREIPAPRSIPVRAGAVPTGPTITTPILPSNELARSPQNSTQIIVSTARPGSMASSMVYSGEPTSGGLEAARRAAQDAAEHAHLQMSALSRTGDNAAIARAAYAETATFGQEG